MNLSKNQLNNLLLVIPAITAFLIVLIPTLKYPWPLSWDIIYHVQYAQIYASYGLTLTDPLLNAPIGQKIGYPPLFHLLIAFLGTLSQADFFEIARSLQPFLAALVVLSVSYVTRRFYDPVAGISAGFLIISSYLLHRILLPLPENLALIFLPLSVYFYYLSIEKKMLKYAVIAGLLFVIIVLTHQAATLCLFLIITSLTLIELLFH
jgi:asparagine N-glycosylation enzyme membrane subunit Stt3